MLRGGGEFYLQSGDPLTSNPTAIRFLPVGQNRVTCIANDGSATGSGFVDITVRCAIPEPTMAPTLTSPGLREVAAGHAPSEVRSREPPNGASSGMTDVAETLRTHFGREAPAGLSSAYLFGSQAAGRAHRESDVDVAVLLDRRRFPDAATRFDLKVRLTSELIHALRANDVNLVVLNDAPPELGRRIVVEGHRVHLADPEADHAYRRDVQLRAADLDPYLRRMRRIKLETLRR